MTRAENTSFTKTISTTNCSSLNWSVTSDGVSHTFNHWEPPPLLAVVDSLSVALSNCVPTDSLPPPQLVGLWLFFPDVKPEFPAEQMMTNQILSRCFYQRLQLIDWGQSVSPIGGENISVWVRDCSRLHSLRFAVFPAFVSCWPPCLSGKHANCFHIMEKIFAFIMIQSWFPNPWRRIQLIKERRINSFPYKRWLVPQNTVCCCETLLAKRTEKAVSQELLFKKTSNQHVH